MHFHFFLFLEVIYKTHVKLIILLTFHLSHKLQWFQHFFVKKWRTSNEISSVGSLFTWIPCVFQQKYFLARCPKSWFLEPLKKWSLLTQNLSQIWHFLVKSNLTPFWHQNFKCSHFTFYTKNNAFLTFQ